ncbi:MAG: Mut7-C RNAse domain-containing protein [Crenarchaeota archaeon]|nr:Mut7-C RNAse domain-containing protein [Thermoproteota archaeon]
MGLRFLVDSMHGYVAKWLRIMGYDTLYLNSVDDEDIVQLALRGRVLVTSDDELAKIAERKGVEVVLTKGLTEEEVLRLLVERFKLFFHEASLRCTVCNGELEPLPAGEAEKNPEVPKNVGLLWRCKACGKVYWRGSHWRNISRQILKLTGSEP